VGGKYDSKKYNAFESRENKGRFPANLIVTDDALNDGVITKSRRSNRGLQHSGRHGGLADIGGNIKVGTDTIRGHSDSGSKSRYFDIDIWAEKHGIIYCPKASKKERNMGCEGLEGKAVAWSNQARAELARGNVDFSDGERKHNKVDVLKNHHPTVKPVHLLTWLVRLVSRQDYVVLDPFVGSGSTGVACVKLKRKFIGIELSSDYCEIAKRRLIGIENNIDNAQINLIFENNNSEEQ